MKRLLKRLLTPFVLKNFPWNITTKVETFDHVRIKKGKIREFRTYDKNGRRVENSKIDFH